MLDLFHEGSSFEWSRWIFLRLLALVYLIAFASLGVQIRGLLGARGILPAEELLRDAKEYAGPKAYAFYPTFFWLLPPTDRNLVATCIAGCVLALLLAAGILPVLCLVLLLVAYLSLTSVGQDFLGFQWDALLIETGFLAILLGDASLPVSPIALFLAWWLLFRLMFASGAGKLTVGDRTWPTLRALDYHYWTQPLPTPLAWYVHNLPAWTRRVSCALMFVIELALPALIFLGETPRQIAAAGFVALMLLIMLTGNYGFFNLLTIALCALLLDDAAWTSILPARVQDLVAGAGGPAATGAAAADAWRTWPTLLALLFLPINLLASTASLTQTLAPDFAVPSWLRLRALAPFRLVNGYGLFRSMTTRRPEIIIETSRDGTTWQPLAFRYKVGPLARRPPFSQPHQPRLDWQMWFAALRTYHAAPWFQRFLVRILQGSPEVRRLLSDGNLDTPVYIRAQLHLYEFTTPAERRAHGHWWKRSEGRTYAPTLRLK